MASSGLPTQRPGRPSKDGPGIQIPAAAPQHSRTLSDSGFRQSASRDTPTELSAQNSTVDTGGIGRRLFILSEVLVVPHVRSRHYFARILQAKAEPGPSHLGFDRHSLAVGLTRVHLTRRFDRPGRLRHLGDCWRRDPLRCNLGVPHLQISTEACEGVDVGSTGSGPLSRERPVLRRYWGSTLGFESKTDY